jgi:hypothetical protein
MQPSAKLKLQRVDYVQVASLKCNSIQLLSSKGEVKQQQKVNHAFTSSSLNFISPSKAKRYLLVDY